VDLEANAVRSPKSALAERSPKAALAGSSPKSALAGRSPKAALAGRSPKAALAGRSPKAALADRSQCTVDLEANAVRSSMYYCGVDVQNHNESVSMYRYYSGRDKKRCFMGRQKTLLIGIIQGDKKRCFMGRKKRC